MKKVCCFWIATLICIVLVGCSRDFNKKDMNQIDMIRLVGLDYDGGEFIITAMYGIGGTDTIVDEIRTIEGRGSDIFTAFENLRSKNSKSISLSYTGFYMVGEGLAENGVTELKIGRAHV